MLAPLFWAWEEMEASFPAGFPFAQMLKVSHVKKQRKKTALVTYLTMKCVTYLSPFNGDETN